MSLASITRLTPLPVTCVTMATTQLFVALRGIARPRRFTMKRCKYRPYLGKYSRLVIDWRWDPVRQMWNNCGCVPWRGLEARGSACD